MAVSVWQATLPPSLDGPPRPPLPGPTDADVAIVGAGFTALWTAHALLRRDPGLRVVLLERETVGFGASGRNGGWCSALLPMSLDAIAVRHGRPAATAFQRAMADTVGEICATLAEEGIDADAAHGGYVHLARNEPQVARLRAEVEHLRGFGCDESDLRWLDADEAAGRVGATRVLGGTYTPHCAAVHPLKLARGLALAVERRGAVIHEHTPVTSIEPGRAITPHGVVRARHVVRATEAFTRDLPGHRRDLAPIYSLMIATEPLPAAVLDSIGLAQRETFNDGRRMIVYGQRTADGRLAFGGRGAPYHYASAMGPEMDSDPRVHAALSEALVDLFPAVEGSAITHRWGGAVAAPRDWWCSVGLDRTTGLAWAGGYVGDGVATTNLAGRTLAALLTEADSPLVDLPWVGHRSRRWEPEPLRWLGINAVVRLPGGADRYEDRTGRPERWRSALLDRVLGG